MNDKLLVTVGEAADRLGLGRTLVYQLVLRGSIRSVKIGRSRRVPVVALEEFVSQRLTATKDIYQSQPRDTISTADDTMEISPW